MSEDGYGFADTLGITGYERVGEDRVRGRMPVTGAILQNHGIVHGGALASLIETVCSRATNEAVGPEQAAFGQLNETTFLRPISEGVAHAEGHARHRGRTSWVWDAEVRDDEGRLCALGRMIVAVRDRPNTDR